MNEPRPNILFVLSDQHRADWLGLAGRVPVQTPHLDALAREGVWFRRAICASPLCGPSRACLASGRDYARCGVPSHEFDFPLELPTFYQRLRDAGYWTMGCGKFDLHKAHYSWGVEGQHLLREWGFCAGRDSAGKWDAVYSGRERPQDPYMAYLDSLGLAQMHVDDMIARGQYNGTEPTPLPDDAYCDNWIGREALGLLAQAPSDAPWFLQVNFAGPHEPMDVTHSMLAPYAETLFPQPHLPDETFSPEQHNAVRRCYAAMVTNIDAWVGAFRALLQTRMEAENTLIIYASDHGEMLGDRGRWGKNVPYAPSVGVPLIVSGPGVAPGGVSAAPVSLIDVGATCLDYAGAAPMPGADSVSLRPVLAGTSVTGRRTLAFSGSGPWRMACDGWFKYARGFLPDGADLLFDLDADPLEEGNIAAERPDVVARLAHALDTQPC